MIKIDLKKSLGAACFKFILCLQDEFDIKKNTIL